MINIDRFSINIFDRFDSMCDKYGRERICLSRMLKKLRKMIIGEKENNKGINQQV